MEAAFVEETAFTSWEETKATIGQRPVHKFFLVDKGGKKQLAVTGEDLGDAHYHYRSSRPFAKYGPLDCRNRTEVLVWLERVISESGGVAGAHLMADDNNPDGVYFTQHSFERAHYPDGRRCSRWYLIDQHGDKHLAVMGIERDTKDGHYNYIAEEPFASIKGLHCSNQSGVFKWLESMITHHPGDADHAAQSRGASAQSGERSRPLVIKLSSLRNARVSAAAQKSLDEAVVAEAGFQRAKPKERKSSGPPPQPVKQKSVGIVQQLQLKKAKKMQEDIIAEEQKLQQHHLIKLRRAAAAEVSADTAAKACTLGWLHGSVVGEDSEHLDTFMSLLAAVLDLQQGQQTAAVTAAADPEQQQTQQQQQVRDLAAGLSDQDMLRWVRQPENRKHHLRVVLECLKELGASDLPARVLLARQVIPLVQRCLTYPNSAAHTMAEHMLDRWRWQLAGHMHVLTCPTYMEDHLGAVEQEITSGQVPLPQLPKHKQALLISAVPKPPIPPGFQTPAPPAKANSNQQQQGPASAPAVLNGPISAMQAAATCIPGFTPMPISTGFTFTPGTAGLQSPGFYTPLSPSGVTTGGLVVSGLATDAAAVAGGFRGTGAKVPGLLGATTGPRGGLVFSSTLSGVGTSTASAARPPGVLNAAGITVNTGLGELAPAAPMTWGSMGLQSWGAVNGLYGGATHIQQQQVHVDPAAVGTIGSNNMDAVSLQQMAAEAAPCAAAAGDGELQSPQLALQLQYQQQLRAQMIMLGQQQAAAAAGTGTGQYVGAMPQGQQQAGQPGRQQQ